MAQLTHFPLALHERPHVVYLLYDAAGTLLYVGVTSRSDGRHQLQRPWLGDVDAARTEHRHADNLAAATKLQAQLIDELKPLHNEVKVKRTASVQR